MVWVRPGAYPRVKPLKVRLQNYSQTLHLAGKAATGKLLSLLQTFINYGRKSFIKLEHWAQWGGGVNWIEAILVEGLGAKLGKGSPIAGKVWSFCRFL